MDYDADTAMPREPGAQAVVENDGQKPLQCVPYAREHSGVKIYGDAYTWWDKAAGKYPARRRARSRRGDGADTIMPGPSAAMSRWCAQLVSAARNPRRSRQLAG